MGTTPPLRLPMQPRDFSFSPAHFLISCSLPQTCEHTCLCVDHANSLHVNGNPGNLLTVSSALTNVAPVIASIPSVPCSTRPFVTSAFWSSEPIQSTQLQTQLLFQFVIVDTHYKPFFSAETLLLVSSSFHYQMHHLLIEQSSVFRDNILVTFFLL